MKNERLEFHGGSFGAIAPFVLFLAGVLALAIAGAPDEKGFWPILLAALALGMALSVDRGLYAERAIAAMSDRIVALMIMAWILAGVLGVILSASGLVQSLVWLARESGATGPWYIGAAFVICCVVSTSTGSSFGTILVAGPLLYPPGGSLGVHSGLLMGAILAGATFGDSVSPVSDTTIASAGSQNTDVPGTVRTRLRYVLPAGALALVTSMMLANVMSPGQAAPVTAGADASPAALPMLIVPLAVIALLLARRHLLEGLLAGIVLALAAGLSLGQLQPHAVFYIDSAAFGASGLIIDGVSRAVGVSIFTLLLMGLVGPIRESGLVERLTSRLGSDSHPGSIRAAELSIVAAMSAVVMLTTHSVVSILAVGPVVRDIGERARIHAYRRANLLDLTACTWPFLLPWFLPTILASTASASGESLGMPRVSPWAAGMANTYSWALVLVLIIALSTGWGRATDRADAPSS
ncbi:MAG: Na+/H+ antiporter NhaC family protein [Gemmatimonadota bacterium]